MVAFKNSETCIFVFQFTNQWMTLSKEDKVYHEYYLYVIIIK